MVTIPKIPTTIQEAVLIILENKQTKVFVRKKKKIAWNTHYGDQKGKGGMMYVIGYMTV